MVVGLGTGETATYAIRRIGALLRAGTLEDIEGVATSLATAAEAVRLGIPLLEDSRATPTDITIDGADEIDPALNLIKGRGGALLREKIVAQTSRRVVIVADHSKLSPVLGTRGPLPVEVVPFGSRYQPEYLKRLIPQAQISFRMATRRLSRPHRSGELHPGLRDRADRAAGGAGRPAPGPGRRGRPRALPRSRDRRDRRWAVWNRAPDPARR